MSSRWRLLLARGASQIMCPIMSGPQPWISTPRRWRTTNPTITITYHYHGSMNKQTEELSQNTFKQHQTASLWIVPNTKMQKDLRSRHHQPQICNEMLKFICKNGEFPSTLHARSLPSSISIRTFLEKKPSSSVSQLVLLPAPLKKTNP